MILSYDPKAPRAIFLEERREEKVLYEVREKVLYEGRTHRSDRAGKTRTTNAYGKIDAS